MTQESQHLAASRVASSPYVDFMCSPASYVDRGRGGTSTFMSCTDSILMRDKLWFNESDNSTHLTGKDDRLAPGNFPENKEQSLGILEREFGHVVSRGAAQWYFNMSGGWYSDPDILSLFGKMVAYRPDVLADRAAPAFEPEIAFLVDELNFCFMTPGSVPEQRLRILLQQAADDRRHVWSLLAVRCRETAEIGEARCSAERLQAGFRPDEGPCGAWSPAGVYSGSTRPVCMRRSPGLGVRNPARMRELTGLELQVDDTPHPFHHGSQAADGSDLSFDAGVGSRSSGARAVRPQTLGTFKDSGRCAVAVKDRGGWFSMWSGVPNVPAPLVRELAKRAGFTSSPTRVTHSTPDTERSPSTRTTRAQRG